MASRGSNQHSVVLPFREAHQMGLSLHPQGQLVYRRGMAHIKLPESVVNAKKK